MPIDASIHPEHDRTMIETLGDGRYRIRSDSKEARITAKAEGYHQASLKLSAGSRFSITHHELSLERVYHRMTIEVISAKSSIYIDDVLIGAGRVDTPVSHGTHRITLRREDAADQTSVLLVDRPLDVRLRHQAHPSTWMPIAAFKTGRAPKQVTFTPDNRFLIVTLLDDTGFDLIDLRDYGRSVRIQPPNSNAKGYVESLMCPEKESFWVSQMTTDRIYEYALPEPAPSMEATAPTTVALRRELPTRGTWSKVIAIDPSYRFLAVSNWVSSTVTILEYATGRLIATLRGLKTPRGLAFSPDGGTLYVCSYDGGRFMAFDTSEWIERAAFVNTGSSFRHVVVSPNGVDLYVSDMGTNRVFRLNAADLTQRTAYGVGQNPNTIDLSPDGKRLFVSCRGPNNPKSYYLRSLVDGEIYIIDTVGDRVEEILAGGNQPTGLDVSPDGRFLAFTNFLDNEVEVYAAR